MQRIFARFPMVLIYRCSNITPTVDRIVKTNIKNQIKPPQLKPERTVHKNTDHPHTKPSKSGYNYVKNRYF